MSLHIEEEEYVWIPARSLPRMSDFIAIPIQSGLDAGAGMTKRSGVFPTS
ncbi:MAG: hypothetical protein Q8O43_03690 [Dehalococcoidia bacterium]|nr:hypothetical protein [Dehalococcoidia bacterium]